MTVRVEVSPVALDVFVEGADRFWGLRSRLEVPLGRVEGARVVQAGDARSDLRFRTGGLGVPGVATVGYHRGKEAVRQWWRVYRADRVVVIDLDDQSHFDRIVLEVDDPDVTASMIERALDPPDR